MKQNQATYARRFKKLKVALKKHFGDEVEFTDTASLRWGPESCIVAHDGSLGFTMWFRDEGSDYGQFVSIIKTRYCSTTGLVGIHVRDTDFGHIIDQIDTALRDGFENIYIKSISK